MKPNLPPQNNEAEMSVLGAVFVDHSCLAKVSTMLHVDDFYSEAHRVIFRTFQNLAEKKSPIDYVTVVGALRASGNLEMVGGAPYLIRLTDIVPTAAHFGHYSSLVREASVRRQLIRRAQEIIAAAHDESSDLSDVLDDAKGGMVSLSAVASNQSMSELLTLEDRAKRYIEYVKNVGTLRFRTGFGDIDNHIRGVAPGEVLTIIAYSGTFKSALLQNLLHGNAERTGLHQLFFSLEMPVEKVFEREVQIQCGLEGREVERDYTDAAWRDHHKAMLDRGSDKVLVCEKSRLPIRKVAGYIDLAKQKYGAIGGVGIDYLGLMQSDGRSIFDKMAALSADLKDMAKTLRVPVVVLAQVNRGYSNSKGLEIEMDAAKGGGDIEAGADFMLGMWSKGERVFSKLLKNRNGPANLRWEMDIDKKTLQFIGTLPFVEEETEESKTEKKSRNENYSHLP